MLKLKNKNEELFDESHNKCKENNFKYNIEYGNSSTLELTKRCTNCKKRKTEIYLLDYTEKESTGDRWARNEIPECACGCKTFEKIETIRKSQNNIIINSKCKDCKDIFKDHYSYQMLD